MPRPTGRFTTKPGLKAVKTDNLVEAIAVSREADLWRVIHGLGVPLIGAEAAKLLAAIRENGGEAWYLLAMDEGHGFRKEENRFDFYGRMESFLASHLKSGGQAGTNP